MSETERTELRMRIRTLERMRDESHRDRGRLVRAKSALQTEVDGLRRVVNRDATTGIGRIARERARHLTVHGWTAEHDDTHDLGELACAGASYALLHTPVADPTGIPHFWPWGPEDYKPSDDPIRNLEKAGALIAGEIDRLLRLKGRGPC